MWRTAAKLMRFNYITFMYTLWKMTLFWAIRGWNWSEMNFMTLLLLVDIKSFLSHLQFDPLSGKVWRPSPEESGTGVRFQPHHNEQEGFPESKHLWQANPSLQYRWIRFDFVWGGNTLILHLDFISLL